MSLLNRYYHGNRQIYGDVGDDYDEDGDNDDVTKSMDVSSISEVRIRNPSGRC